MRGQPRLCAKCAHIHGGGKFGLCFERLPDKSICPCLVAEIVVIPIGRRSCYPPTRKRPPRTGFCERTHIRRAQDVYVSLTPEDRAVLERVARRLDETMLTLEEYAAEVGIDKRLIWRARRDMGLRPQPAVVGAPMRRSNA